MQENYQPDFNQPEIDSADQHLWREQRLQIYARLADFCQKNKLGFRAPILPGMNLDWIHYYKWTDKIVVSTLFDLIPYPNYWKNISDQCNIIGKKVFVITDNILDSKDFEFDNVKVFSCPELLGVTASYHDPVKANRNPSKLFNCFIQRVDSMRQAWFYLLHLYDLLDKGYVSFLLKQLASESKLTGIELFDQIRDQWFDPTVDSAYFNAHEVLRSQVPYRNFDEQNNLIPLILDSRYSLVLETYVGQDRAPHFCFTEKILRGLQFPVTNLLFGQPQSALKLRQLGLQVDPVMHEADDLLEADRQQHLLNILVNNSCAVDYDYLEDRSVHNRDLINSWKQSYQNSNYFESIFEEILST